MTDEDEQIRLEKAALEAFDPSQPLRKIVFQWPDAGNTLHEHVFVQGPLGHFATIEFGIIIKGIIKDVMGGKYGVDVKEIIRDRSKLSAAQAEVEHAHGGKPKHSHSISFDGMSPDAVEVLVLDHDCGSTSELRDMHEHVETDMGAVYEQWRPYIEAFLEILGDLPDVEQELMALSLGVRKRDRKEFKERISEAPHAGGLTNTQATDIIKVFIQQNAGEIRRFLGDQLREIGEVFMDAIEGMVPQEPESSTNSAGTTPSSTSSAPIPA